MLDLLENALREFGAVPPAHEELLNAGPPPHLIGTRLDPCATISVFRVSNREGRLGRSRPRYRRPHLTRVTLPKADLCSSSSTSD
jgi:hypothetical protein